MPLARDIIILTGTEKTISIYVPQGKRIKSVMAENLTGYVIRCSIRAQDTPSDIHAIQFSQKIAEGLCVKAIGRAWYQSLFAFCDILPFRDYDTYIHFQFFNDTSHDIKVLCAVVFDEEPPITTKRARP